MEMESGVSDTTFTVRSQVARYEGPGRRYAVRVSIFTADSGALTHLW